MLTRNITRSNTSGRSRAVVRVDTDPSGKASSDKFTMSASGTPPSGLVDRIRRLLPSGNITTRIRKRQRVAAAVGRYLDVLRCATLSLSLLRWPIEVGWDFWQRGAFGYLPYRYLDFKQALTSTRMHSNRARCHLSPFPS